MALKRTDHALGSSRQQTITCNVIAIDLQQLLASMHGFVANSNLAVENLDHELETPTDTRIFVIAQALHEGYSIERLHELTKIDAWFLQKLNNIYELHHQLVDYSSLEDLPPKLLLNGRTLASSLQLNPVAVSSQLQRGLSPSIRQRQAGQ